MNPFAGKLSLQVEPRLPATLGDCSPIRASLRRSSLPPRGPRRAADRLARGLGSLRRRVSRRARLRLRDAGLARHLSESGRVRIRAVNYKRWPLDEPYDTASRHVSCRAAATSWPKAILPADSRHFACWGQGSLWPHPFSRFDHARRKAIRAPQRVTLPLSLPPRGLSRVQAAEYIGVIPSTFDKMVADGQMPAPKKMRGREFGIGNSLTGSSTHSTMAGKTHGIESSAAICVCLLSIFARMLIGTATCGATFARPENAKCGFALCRAPPISWKNIRRRLRRPPSAAAAGRRSEKGIVSLSLHPLLFERGLQSAGHQHTQLAAPRARRDRARAWRQAGRDDAGLDMFGGFAMRRPKRRPPQINA